MRIINITGLTKVFRFIGDSGRANELLSPETLELLKRSFFRQMTREYTAVVFRRASNQFDRNR